MGTLLTSKGAPKQVIFRYELQGISTSSLHTRRYFSLGLNFRKADYFSLQTEVFYVDITMVISRTNVATVGSVFNDTRKVKVLSLPETIKEKSTFRAKALRRELVGRGAYIGL